MSSIIIDGRKIKAFECMQELGIYTEKTKEFIDALWMDLLSDDELMAEFMYFLDEKTFKDELKCQGYALTDLYFYQLQQYNIVQDTGKNEEDCNKYTLVLNAFRMMVDLRKKPAEYKKKLSEDQGLDRLN